MSKKQGGLANCHTALFGFSTGMHRSAALPVI